MYYLEKYNKYKIKYLKFKNQIGGDLHSENMDLYKRFLSENTDNILLRGIDRNYELLEIQKRKYIECYYEPFRSLIEILMNNIKYETFESFYEKMIIMIDILKSIKTDNDIYVLIFKLPESKETLRNNNLLTKSNIWCNNLVGLNMIEQIDYLFEQLNIETTVDFVREIELKHPGKNIVFINADDCSYSGNQLQDYINNILKIKSNFAHNKIQFITLVPFIINKKILNFYTKIVDIRFVQILTNITEWSHQIKATSEIIEENNDLYLTCLTVLLKLLCDEDVDEKTKEDRELIFNKIIKYIFISIRQPNLMKEGLIYIFINPILLKNKYTSPEQIRENNELYYRIKQIIILYIRNIIESKISGVDTSIFDRKEIIDEINYIVSQIRLVREDNTEELKEYYNNDIEEHIVKIKSNIYKEIYNFINIKMSNTSLIYFDFTLADYVSVNRYLLSGALFGNDLYGFLRKNRAREIGLEESLYLTEGEKKCLMNIGCVPIINNCHDKYIAMNNPDNDSMSCPGQLYKKIIYRLNTTNISFADAELKTITEIDNNTSIIDLLRRVYR